MTHKVYAMIVFHNISLHTRPSSVILKKSNHIFSLLIIMSINTTSVALFHFLKLKLDVFAFICNAVKSTFLYQLIMDDLHPLFRNFHFLRVRPFHDNLVKLLLCFLGSEHPQHESQEMVRLKLTHILLGIQYSSKASETSMGNAATEKTDIQTDTNKQHPNLLSHYYMASALPVYSPCLQ